MDVKENGVQIRVPATAQLCIDSFDRLNPVTTTPWNFTINKPQSILNGFFNRIATSEVVLEWNEPNILTTDTISLTIDGYGANPLILTPTNTVNGVFMTAREALDWLVEAINDVAPAVPGAPYAAFYNPTEGTYGLESDAQGTDFIINDTPLARRMGFPVAAGIPAPGIPFWPMYSPDLRPYRYLDFVSEQLTYNQELKDDSTNSFSRNTLCRWYFAFDNPPELDGYGWPILMGYTPFVLRRLYNPPKQIKWDPRQPVGQLSFQVYTDAGVIVPNVGIGNNASSQWLMTLQVSEN
jgi:hypothetical protein